MVEWFGSVLGCCEHLITPPPSCLKLGILFLVQAEGGGLGGRKLQSHLVAQSQPGLMLGESTLLIVALRTPFLYMPKLQMEFWHSFFSETF
jgi:hypothetical protein